MSFVCRSWNCLSTDVRIEPGPGWAGDFHLMRENLCRTASEIHNGIPEGSLA